ncbi:MAG: hypothetical protein RLZ62_1989 [Bacteroidota bacterium]
MLADVPAGRSDMGTVIQTALVFRRRPLRVILKCRIARGAGNDSNKRVVGGILTSVYLEIL